MALEGQLETKEVGKETLLDNPGADNIFNIIFMFMEGNVKKQQPSRLFPLTQNPTVMHRQIRSSSKSTVFSHKEHSQIPPSMEGRVQVRLAYYRVLSLGLFQQRLLPVPAWPVWQSVDT